MWLVREGLGRRGSSYCLGSRLHLLALVETIEQAAREIDVVERRGRERVVLVGLSDQIGRRRCRLCLLLRLFAPVEHHVQLAFPLLDQTIVHFVDH